MTEELKNLYIKLFDTLEQEDDEPGADALRKILDYESALFSMHFGDGPMFRKLVLCGLCLGLAAIIMEEADEGDEEIISSVESVAKEIFTKKEEMPDDERTGKKV